MWIQGKTVELRQQINSLECVKEVALEGGGGKCCLREKSISYDLIQFDDRWIGKLIWKWPKDAYFLWIDIYTTKRYHEEEFVVPCMPVNMPMLSINAYVIFCIMTKLMYQVYWTFNDLMV